MTTGIPTVKDDIERAQEKIEAIMTRVRALLHADDRREIEATKLDLDLFLDRAINKLNSTTCDAHAAIDKLA